MTSSQTSKFQTGSMEDSSNKANNKKARVHSTQQAVQPSKAHNQANSRTFNQARKLSRSKDNKEQLMHHYLHHGQQTRKDSQSRKKARTLNLGL